ncbi:hypothetical protein NSK11_contig00239-0004 [Nocardia seriolae]|uniref:Uncharacterized protein n=1 Tax=Nocardia seriolae TaxID=37332 RepID=A0ABC9Z6T3_9NOCA|nr:hypothetical protein NSERKGN1266_08390 [Nocardia seriolae]BEK99715.1 hypothetical protein NSER024013_76210 [Nocardia seriolae]GAM51353.1 hypothetical protein NS07_v2contig00238-0004 [Nocardia seriolae]GAP33316.1 hypothetical protein NSK11_contig00239-0004 [Nocardia seriolae]GEM28440.1 hypothetical protein NS2_66790 [Nocardia seriolae NBRC 15557]
MVGAARRLATELVVMSASVTHDMYLVAVAALVTVPVITDPFQSSRELPVRTLPEVRLRGGHHLRYDMLIVHKAE